VEQVSVSESECRFEKNWVGDCSPLGRSGTYKLPKWLGQNHLGHIRYDPPENSQPGHAFNMVRAPVDMVQVGTRMY